MTTQIPARPLNVAREVAALQRMTVKQLRDRFAEVFGDSTTTGNKTWLVRRITWRLQVLAEGDLSERARARANELARDADLRIIPPPARVAAPPVSQPVATPGPRPRDSAFASDPRLPPPGTILTRKYKGGVVEVTIREDGFEYAGEVYPSLSAAAKAITGSHCNGFLFFKLLSKGGAA